MITFAKLKNGTRGIRADRQLILNSKYWAIRRDGDRKEVIPTALVYSGQSPQGMYYLYEIRSDRTAPNPARKRSYEQGYAPVRGCGTCASLGRMCKRCEFDEYDI